MGATLIRLLANLKMMTNGKDLCVLRSVRRIVRDGSDSVFFFTHTCTNSVFYQLETILFIKSKLGIISWCDLILRADRPWIMRMNIHPCRCLDVVVCTVPVEFESNGMQSCNEWRLPSLRSLFIYSCMTWQAGHHSYSRSGLADGASASYNRIGINVGAGLSLWSHSDWKSVHHCTILPLLLSSDFLHFKF
jgi:hypothetical protein